MSDVPRARGPARRSRGGAQVVRDQVQVLHLIAYGVGRRWVDD